VWETEWLSFRGLYFCLCQITSVASKSCSFSPIPWILTCNSQSLLWMQAYSSQFCKFCGEKALLQFAVCKDNSSSICASLVRWEDQHSGVLREVAAIPSYDQLVNAALWLLLSSNPLVSIQPFLPQGDGTCPCRPKVQLLQKKEKNKIRNIVANYALTARTKVKWYY